MTRTGRVRAEASAAWRSFLRRRTAVFFTFFFPAILVVIFGALVRTSPTGGGLFAEPPGYYLAGYVAVVVLFTPLTRLGSEIARHRAGNRFEKLATTPLARWEWLLAHTLVNALVIGLAAALVVVLVIALTGAALRVTPALALLAPFVAFGVALFCGLGAILGRLADSQDGVVAASNAIALPLLFLSDTFVQPDLLPDWFEPALWLSPLSYFACGVRAVTYSGLCHLPGGTIGPLAIPGGTMGPLVIPGGTMGPLVTLGILGGLAAVFFAAGAYAIPRTD